jgi:hypothetical protein
MQARFLRDTTRLVSGITVAAFALVVFIFFGYYYPHHLHYHEQFQLFELTTDYARQVLYRPGGMADYIGGFLTQFFINSRFGGCFLALLLVGVQQLTARRIGRRYLTTVLSYLPSLALLYYLMDENAMPSTPVAMLGCLTCAEAMTHVPGRGLRLLIAAVLTPVMYLLWGGLAVIYVVAMAVSEAHRSWNARCSAFLIVSLLLLVACPLVAQYIWPFPLYQLYGGIHYFRYPAMVPKGAWVAAAFCMGVMALSLFLKPKVWTEGLSRGRAALHKGWQAVSVVAASILLCHYCANWNKERVMAYDFYARYQQWDQILLLAHEHPTTWAMNIAYLNLALGMTGNLPEHQFNYFQYSAEGLIPPFERDFTSPLPASEALYYLGFINDAQRYTFEVQEAVPDGQHSVRCFQRLAETAMIMGDYPVARKYLRPLQHTLFYKEWAQKAWRLTEDEREMEMRPLYSRLRHFCNTEDYLFSDKEIDSMIGRLFLSRPDNRMAFEYLMSYELLNRRLDLFMQYISLGGKLGYKRLPRSYQEALLLHWTLSHTDFKGFQWEVSPALKQQMVNFINDYRANKPIPYMMKMYQGTYWLFYILETEEKTVE